MNWAEQLTDAIDRLQRSPRDMLIARTAFKHHLPYSQVRDNWSDEDLAVEEALQTIEFRDQMARCQRCGVDPDEMLNEFGRPAAEPLWELEVTMCETCQTVSEEESKANKDSDPHRRYTASWKPRKDLEDSDSET